MAIDNSLYDSIENTYFQIKDYLDNIKLGPEHSPMIIKQEELADFLEEFDIEAIEEQSKDIDALHNQFNAIKEVSNKIAEDLKNDDDSTTTAANVVSGLEEVFLKIKNIVV